MPNKKVNILAGAFGRGWETTLPGLSHFYLAGQCSPCSHDWHCI
jgi:hypothetical protein